MEFQRGFKMNKYLMLLFFVCGCSFSADSSPHWERFLKTPDDGSFAALHKSISVSSENCGWGNPSNLSVVPIEVGQKLFQLIATGNEYAFRAGLLVVRCFDGGELEDFHRSAGLFFDAQPNVFLTIAKENEVSETDVKYMLTILPPASVDNIDYAIHVVESRIALLERNSGPRFDEITKIGLKFLKEQEMSLKRIKQGGA